MLTHVLRFSIQHRWLVLLLTTGVAAAGLLALRRLPIDAVPDITNVQVQVNSLAPALSPAEIEKQVTFPVETALAGISGLDHTRSLSRNGFSQVVAVFDDGTDIFFARQQVGERLLAARESIPEGVEPTMGPVATGLGEVYMYAVAYEHPRGQGAPVSEGEAGWQSDGYYRTPEGDLLRTEVELGAYLRTVQDWILAPQLRQVRNVAGVDSLGGWVKQFHVQPDPMKLAARGLTFADVISALERNNSAIGAGYVEHGGEAHVVRAGGRVRTREEIARIAVATRHGVPVHVSDVAQVIIGPELRTGSASMNGNEVVIGTAIMLLGANSRSVAADVDLAMIEARRSLPPGVVAKTVLNRTELVDATIHTVAKNLAEGALLVVVVLFLLLGNFRASLIAALAIPLSMLVAALAMLRWGVSGNLMSLGALDFGIIVDGAVIVVENCLRLLAERQRALGRTLNLRERLHEVMVASQQMVQPSVYGQAIIITVYVPILALTGVEGKMFHPMALTVIFALLGALVLSLTFVPAMVALLIRGRVAEHESRVVTAARRLYAPALDWALAHRKAVIVAAAASFAAGCLLFASLGQVFIPTLDEGNLALQSLRIPSTSLTQSQAMQNEVERAITALPEVDIMFSKTGTAEVAFDPMPPSISDGFIMLAPRDSWPNPKLSRGELIEKVEVAARSVRGSNYEMSQPIQLRFNELLSGIRSDVAVKVFGDEFDTMSATAERIANVLREVPGARDVKVEAVAGLPALEIDVDRAALARHGLSVADVQDVVAAAIGGREAGEVFEGDRRFALVVRLPEELRHELRTLAQLAIPVPAGALGDSEEGGGHGAHVPLSAVASIQVREGLNQVSRENGKRRIVVQANVRGRDLGGFVADAQQAVSGVTLPPGSWIEWGGQFENLEAARKRLGAVVPICFFAIFLLLFSTFNSAKYALIVFTGVPLALTGGVLALWMRGIPFSISAAVGFIALSGVAVLNGLVMVSYINHLRKEGRPLDSAVREGSLARLRPVLMTALVASLGFVPMAIATGRGAEVQRPLATVVIGGIVSSTLLTLLVLPALYRLWHRRDEKLAARDDDEELEHPQPTVT